MSFSDQLSQLTQHTFGDIKNPPKANHFGNRFVKAASLNQTFNEYSFPRYDGHKPKQYKIDFTTTKFKLKTTNLSQKDIDYFKDFVNIDKSK